MKNNQINNNQKENAQIIHGQSAFRNETTLGCFGKTFFLKTFWKLGMLKPGKNRLLMHFSLEMCSFVYVYKKEFCVFLFSFLSCNSRSLVFAA